MPNRKRPRDKDGTFVIEGDPIVLAKERQQYAAKEQGMSYKHPEDIVEMEQEALDRHHMIKNNEKKQKLNRFGISEEAWDFFGFPRSGANFKHALPSDHQIMQNDTTAAYYTPADDFYASPGGYDTAYDYGRVPISHLMILESRRLGIVHRACHGIASDVFRNEFDVVNIDNREKIESVPEMERWMETSYLWDKLVEWMEFSNTCGLGHLIAKEYFREKPGKGVMAKEAPSSRPKKWEALSAYFMTPTNLFESEQDLDYDKLKWNYIGGAVRPQVINHSRNSPLEMLRVEGGIRGLGLPEICWVPLMCYLNTMYYALKAESSLGLIWGSVTVDKEYPSATDVTKYSTLWNDYQANKLAILGKSAIFKLENVEAKFSGLREIVEFYLEDVSAAWIFPKNQLLGRAEGGGLSGAGALVSKDDYLASNISTKQLKIRNDLQYILEIMCGFKQMEDKRIRFNIDLHKTEEQRLREEMMREQLVQLQISTKMQKMQAKVMKIQLQQAEMQFKIIEANPKKYLLPDQSQGGKEGQGKGQEKIANEDEEVKAPKAGKFQRPSKADFTEDMIKNQELMNKMRQDRILQLQERELVKKM